MLAELWGSWRTKLKLAELCESYEEPGEAIEKLEELWRIFMDAIGKLWDIYGGALGELGELWRSVPTGRSSMITARLTMVREVVLKIR